LDLDPYRALARAVLELANKDAHFVASCRPAILPETLRAPARFQVESARVWLTKEGPGLEMWCQWVQVQPRTVTEHGSCMLRVTLREESRLRDQCSTCHTEYVTTEDACASHY
jgi:hypothetical protein